MLHTLGVIVLFFIIWSLQGFFIALIATFPIYFAGAFVFYLIQAAVNNSNENHELDNDDYGNEDFEAYEIEGERYFYYVDRTGLVTLRHVLVLDDDEDRIETVDFTAGRRQRTFIKERILKELTEKEFNKLPSKEKEETIAKLQENFLVKEKNKNYQKNTGNQVEVCFTGFGKVEKAELISLAKEKDMLVRDSVTAKLDILVTGDNAGPSKTQSAKGKGIKITDAEGFKNFIETGEI